MLRDVAAITWNAVVEQQAIKTLYDPDGEAAANAAATLSEFGGKEDQGLLLQRLEKWSKNGADSALGQALFQALEYAHAWVVDQALAQRLAGLCLNETCRQKWANYQVGPVRLQSVPGLYGFGRVLQVGMRSVDGVAGIEERMGQYPAATVFHWCMPEWETDRPEVERFANKHQLTLLSCPK